MTLAIGLGAFAGWGESTAAWGAVASRTAWMELHDGADGLSSEVDDVKSGSLFRATINAADVLKGNVRAQGTLKHQARFAGWTRALKYLLCHASSTSGSGPYTHTFEPQDSLSAIDGQSGLTVEIFRGSVGAGGGGADESFIFAGGMPRGVTFSFERGQPLEIEWDFVFQNVTMGAKSTPTFDAAALIAFPSPATSPSAFLTWNSLTPLVRSGSVSIKRSLDEERYPIQRQTMAQPIPNGEFEISASIEVEFENSTIWDDFQAATKRNLSLVIEGATPANESLTFLLRNCTVKGEPQVGDRGAVLVTLEFMAYHDGSNKALTITLVNSESTIQ